MSAPSPRPGDEKVVLQGEHAGFCWGVRRALRLAERCRAQSEAPVATLGPLIHNPPVVEALAERGIRAVDDLDLVTGGAAVVRAHGLPPAQQAALRQRGVTLVDGTCPFVARSQDHVARIAGEGRAVIIIGDRKHPEVVALSGFAAQGAFVVATLTDLHALPPISRGGAVVQSTLIPAQVEALVEGLRARIADFVFHPTFCDVVTKSQDEARALARQSRAMVVIGGKGSSNTRKLAEICAEHCERVFTIETIAELDALDLPERGPIGLTGGTSTPPDMIEHARLMIEARLEKAVSSPSPD